MIKLLLPFPFPRALYTQTTTSKSSASFSSFLFSRTQCAQFSTTSAQYAKHSKRRLVHLMRNIPPYPYPVKHTFKQSWFGLYDGKHIQFGNNIADSDQRTKTLRTWLPNIKNKKLYSHALGEFVEVRLVTSVLRTIDKVGGLDEYLLSSKPARLARLGPFGWRLRWRIINTPIVQKRFEEERRRLGLIEDVPKSVEGGMAPESEAEGLINKETQLLATAKTKASEDSITT